MSASARMFVVKKKKARNPFPPVGPRTARPIELRAGRGMADSGSKIIRSTRALVLPRGRRAKQREFVVYLCEIPSLEASSLALEIVIVGTAAAATSAVVVHPVAIVSTGIE